MENTTPRSSTRWRRLESPVLLALLLVLLGLLFDWNWLRGPIERRVEAATGRAFHIGGDLEGDIGRVLTLRAADLRLGNAAGSPEPDMGRARRVEVQVEWHSLIEGDLVIPAVTADHVQLLLERDTDGNGNWEFKGPEGAAVDVRNLTLRHGSLHVVERGLGTDLAIAASTGQIQPGQARAPLVLSGSGRFHNQPFSLSGTVESPLELANQARPYHIDVTAHAGSTHGHAQGELVTPLQLSGYDLAFQLSGPNLASLYPLLGLALPDSPPYRLDGRLSHQAHVWIFRDFHGKVGQSDLAGNTQVDVGPKRAVLHADLDSRHLDLADLGGFVGATPGAVGNGLTESQVSAATPSDRVLPRARYDLPKLRSMDADVKLHAATVSGAPLPAQRLSAHLTMNDGIVRIDPLRFDLADGEVAGWIRYDARGDALRGSAELEARNIDVPKVLPDVQLAKGSVGRVGGTLKVEGRGNSVAELMAHANGSLRGGMGEGKISNLLMEKAGLDLAEMLKFKLTGDRLIPIRCAGADFAIEDGVMNTRNLVFDTTDTRVDGEGKVSLRDETLALRLHVRPKDRSPLALRTPIEVKGTFKDPKFGPEKRALTLRALATGALFMLAPPLMLAGTVDLGGGKDATCPVVRR